ncbi:MAG TPA: amidase family protein [Hyphomicrobiaceae bacterium]|nr:amidase family protein [Hyphomicrobiaceae bacterium]
MTERPLWQWSACELAAGIAGKRVSAVEVVEATVTRMRARNGKINAVVDDLGDEALSQAAELDRIMVASGPIGPLHGVPVTIKENVDQKGRATPNGVPAFKDVIAPANAPIVRNLTKAGAIVIGRTNTPEFSFRATTDNPLHGRTFNPWNDRASPGGSSGGASAAVMSGMGPIGHGNDIGGSLRFPAWATGAATVKPGLGRTPAYNPSQSAERGLLAQLMSVQGVIAREVRDVRLAMRALVAYDPHDPWMVPMPFDGPAPDGPVRVAFTKNMFEFDLDPAVAQALDGARAALADAGYMVEEIEPPLLREAARDANRCLFGEMKVLMGADIRRHGSATINQIFDDYFEIFEAYEGEDLLLGLAKRAAYVRAWQLFMEEYPLVLTPFMPTPTFDWDRDAQGSDGVREVLGAGIYSFSMNYMGLPAGNVPASLNGGLPIGVQIVGRRFREDMILDACEAIEQRVGVMAHTLFEREA